jgi:hypothetical protein
MDKSLLTNFIIPATATAIITATAAVAPGIRETALIKHRPPETTFSQAEAPFKHFSDITMHDTGKQACRQRANVLLQQPCIQ